MARGRAVPPIYELNLLDNGLDFVKSGIELFFRRSRPRPNSHKYAILHVFSGMLLLLKERLARIRPSLVFQDEGKAGQPGAKTTDYHTTLNRLEAHGICIDPTKRMILDEIRVLRNAIEHYRLSIPLARSEAAIGQMVAFVYLFCRDELGLHVDDRLAGKAQDRFYDLKEIGDRIGRDIDESVAADAEADDRYFQAFEDQYRAMSPDELLRHAATLNGVAIADVPRVECPRCHMDALVLLETGACTNPACRSTHRIGTCHCCQGDAFDGAFLCAACRNG